MHIFIFYGKTFGLLKEIAVKYLIIFLLLFVLSCSEEKTSEKNPCDLCLDYQYCVNNVCKNLPNLCGTVKCTETQTCIDEVCVNNEDLCGSVLCSENQICENQFCVDKPVLCGNIYCQTHETCEENICKKIFTFATYNLYDLTYQNAYENLAKYIKDYNIDVITVQEIQPEDKDLLLTELNKLGISMNAQYSSYGGYGGDTGDDYLAVFSRYPLSNVETILSGTYQDPISKAYYTYSNMRPVLKINITVFNNPVTIYNIHLKAQSPYPDCTDCLNKRRAQAFALENLIKETFIPESDKIIIAGDANTALATDFQQGQTLDLLTLKSDNPDVTNNDFTSVNYQFKNEPTHTTYDNLMDHIILSPALMNLYIENSIDVLTPEGKPSDHKSVILKLEF